MNVQSPHIFLPLEGVYLGPECMELIQIIPKSEADRIKLDCLQFYIVALKEIQKRLPINSDTIFKEMVFLDQQIALGLDATRNETSSFEFRKISEFLKIDQNTLILEWRSFPNHFTGSQKTVYSQDPINEFWWTVSTLKNLNDKVIFPEISKLALYPVVASTCQC